MKKCCLCRRDLMPGSSPQCDKCKKNEAKYGKPTECIYCKLPAAFVDNKCVHCSYSERKNGPPQACSRCGSKSAFTRNPLKLSKNLLCRLCQPVHGNGTSTSSKSHETHYQKRGSIGDESRAEKRSRTEHEHHSHSTSRTNASATSTVSMNNINNEIANTQALKDKIIELNRTIMEKNQMIKDQQQKIVELEATQMRKDTNNRQKLINLEKQHDLTVSNLQDQIKQLNKELASKRTRH
ncbi:Protein FAM76B [Aphelenchoides besseyi]|nr:Protein FAM76B [Aphelenchoides besseyi]